MKLPRPALGPLRIVLPTAVLIVVLVPVALLVFAGEGESPALDIGECPPADQLPSLQVQSTVVSTHTPEPFTPTPSPDPTATPAPDAGLQPLQAAMQRAVDAYGVPGRYSVAVTDLRTGETASVNGARLQFSGCSVNFFVLLQVARDLQDGRYGRDRVDDLVAATTWSSNAVTARDLYAIAGDGDAMAGVTRVAALMRTLGMSESVLNHPPLFLDLAGSDAASNLLTAEESNRALLAVWRGQVIDAEWSDYFWDHLSRVKPGLNYLLGILTDVSVSHKNGFFQVEEGFVDNDMGIARWQAADGEAGFAFTFLSEGVAVKYADITLGQQLVRLAYNHFVALYPPR